MQTRFMGITAGLLLFGSTFAADMPQLARKYECQACHAIDKTLVGPAWLEVSKKYKGASRYTYEGSEYPLEEGLVLKISRGGAGNWGKMPMPANDPNNTRQADLHQLVRYILGLAK